MSRMTFMYACLALSLIWTAGVDGGSCTLKENGVEKSIPIGESYFSNTLCRLCLCHPTEGLQCSAPKTDNCNMAEAVTGK